MTRTDEPTTRERRGTLSDAVRRGWQRLVTSASPDEVRREPLGHEPRRAGFARVLGVCLAGFFIWFLLDAPTLQHNAQVSPVGTRRTVALGILGPFATVSRDLGLSHVVSVFDGVVGRHGNRPGNGQRVLRTVGPAKKYVTKTTTPANAPNLHPSATDPLRVLVLGDSLGIDLGNVLVNDLSATGVVQATLDGQISTGLTRPDYFNWPAELSADLPKYSPQVIVVMIGANDAQDMPGPPDVPYGSPAWDAIYRSRVNGFMAEATSQGARVIWVGMPPMENPGLSADMANINGIDQQAASSHPGVDFVSSWTVLGTPQGQFTPYLVVNGQEVNVREPDGTHIAPGGAQVLSTLVENTMKSALRINL